MKVFSTSHLIKAEDINNHETLYAGRMAEWFVESAYLAAAQSLASPDVGQMVCVNIANMQFLKPVVLGDILSIESHVASASRTSMTVEVKAKVRGEVRLEGRSVFVCVDHDGKKIPHGYNLPV